MRLVSPSRNNPFFCYIYYLEKRTALCKLLHNCYLPMRIHTIKHSLISVNVVLEILSKIGELGLKKNNENSTCKSCKLSWLYVVLQKYFKSEGRLCMSLCTYYVVFISARKVKKLDVATYIILSYGKEKRLNTKFIHRLTRTGSRSISNQALSESQSWAGFSISLGTVEPPANKKRHSS